MAHRVFFPSFFVVLFTMSKRQRAQEFYDESIDMFELLKKKRVEDLDVDDMRKLRDALRVAVTYEYPADAPTDLPWETDEKGRPTVATLEALRTLGCRQDVLEFLDVSGKKTWCTTWDDDLQMYGAWEEGEDEDEDANTVAVGPVRWSVAHGLGFFDAERVDEGFGRGLPDNATLDALVAHGLRNLHEEEGEWGEDERLSWEDKAGDLWVLKAAWGQKDVGWGYWVNK